MLYDLSNGFDLEKFRNRTIDLINQRAVVDLTKKNPNRSLSQNAYLHLILGFFAVEYGCTLDEVKVDFFKRTCNKAIFEKTIENKQGQTVTVLRSTASLDSGEMSLAIDRFRQWAVAEASIYLPDANEQQFLIHMQKEIERNKQWI